MDGNVKTVMLFPYLATFVILLTFPFHFAYADEFGIKSYIDKGIDFLGNFGSSTVDNTDIDDSYKSKIDDAIKTGTPVAKEGINFWLMLHEWIVHMIFNNSPLPIPAFVVTLVGFGLVGFLLWHFLRKTLKILFYVALVIIAIFLIVMVFGTNFNFMGF